MMITIQKLAAENRKYTSGSLKESDASLKGVETSLQIKLPEDVRWYLKECGYGECHAISNIQSTVSDTLRFRQAVSLPNRFVVIEDRNDAGAILLDTDSSSGSVLWVDTNALPRIASNQLSQSDHDIFPNFVSWVSYCLDEAKDDTAT